MNKKLEYIPQFKDGSGWDLDNKKAPYYYEHIDKKEGDVLENFQKATLYQVTTIVPIMPVHRNTYFVKGDYIEEFINDFRKCWEYVVDIKKVYKIPSFKKKLILK